MGKIKIGNKRIGEDEPCFIIAEAGVNHNGSVILAKKLIDQAKSCGADAIKFQTYITEELVTADAPKADYQKKYDKKESQSAMLKRLELNHKEFLKIIAYCRKKNIIFLSSAFDPISADFLNRAKMTAFKIGSGEITNLPLISKIAGFNKPIILSTGMADISDIKTALKTIYEKNNHKVILLHCTTNYPAKMEEINLLAISSMKKKFKVPIGFSDHTPGIIVSMASRVLGACVLEKHFTLDKKMIGPDHQASLDFNELKNLVESIRNIEKALGDGIKKPQKSELEIRKVVRKSVVAIKNIPKGEKITLSMLALRRPGTGIEPKDISKIVGKIAKKDIVRENMILWRDLNNAK